MELQAFANAAAAGTPLAALIQQGGLGFSFAGSGFLILFYTGVVAVLQQVSWRRQGTGSSHRYK